MCVDTWLWVCGAPRAGTRRQRSGQTSLRLNRDPNELDMLSSGLIAPIFALVVSAGNAKEVGRDGNLKKASWPPYDGCDVDTYIAESTWCHSFSFPVDPCNPYPGIPEMCFDDPRYMQPQKDIDRDFDNRKKCLTEPWWLQRNGAVSFLFSP